MAHGGYLNNMEFIITRDIKVLLWIIIYLCVNTLLAHVFQNGYLLVLPFILFIISVLLLKK